MLSKEEIKNIQDIKDMLDYTSICVHSNLQLDNKSSKLLYSYIEELENIYKELIEKLEECATSYYTLNEYEEYVRNKDVEEFAQEILKIVKGEKE